MLVLTRKVGERIVIGDNIVEIKKKSLKHRYIAIMRKHSDGVGTTRFGDAFDELVSAGIIQDDETRRNG